MFVDSAFSCLPDELMHVLVGTKLVQSINKLLKRYSFKRKICILIIVRIRYWEPACDSTSWSREAREKLQI